MTTSRAPWSRVVRPWPIDSRMALTRRRRPSRRRSRCSRASDLDPQICVGQTDLVACGRAVQGGVSRVDRSCSFGCPRQLSSRASSGESRLDWNITHTHVHRGTLAKVLRPPTPGRAERHDGLGLCAHVSVGLRPGTICRPRNPFESAERDQCHRSAYPRFEPNRRSRGDVEPEAVCRFAIERSTAGLAAGRWRCEPI